VEAVKERAIRYIGPEVRAVLASLKSQKRIPIRPQPESRENESVPGSHGTFFHGWNMDHETFTADDIIQYCPAGKPGDRLWVKENFHLWGLDPEDPTVHYEATSRDHVCEEIGWKSSYHMPRWASRILLEVVSVRVERLQAISINDCRAEGVRYIIESGEARTWEGEFQRLWDSIHAKRGFGWDKNPWVWVIETKVVTT